MLDFRLRAVAIHLLGPLLTTVGPDLEALDGR
jgi:hypothetical protein